MNLGEFLDTISLKKSPFNSTNAELVEDRFHDSIRLRSEAERRK